MKEQEQYNLVIKFLKGETSPEENENIRNFLKDDTNKKVYDEIVLIWKASYKNIHIDQKKKEIELKKLTNRIERIHNKEKISIISTHKRKRTVQSIAKIAAILLVLVIPFSIYFRNYVGNPDIIDDLITKTTLQGQRSSIILSDGTKVYLNSNTQLTYPKTFSENKRQISLVGEAYFEVTKDPNRPFLIKTGNLITKVLGTTFNTKAFEEDSIISISLVEGKVKILDQANNDLDILEPSQEFVYKKSSNQYAKQAFDLDKVTAWKNNILIFDGERLEDISKILERWYGVKIIIKNNAIKKCKLKAKFENEPLINVLNTLKFAGDFEFKIKDSIVEIDGTGC